MLSVKEVANMIDHTNLKPYAIRSPDRGGCRVSARPDDDRDEGCGSGKCDQ